MSSNDPFKSLADAISAAKSRPQPASEAEVRQRILGKFTDFFSMIAGFEEVMSNSGHAIYFTHTQTDVGNNMVHGQITIKIDGKPEIVLPMFFQGEVLWIKDSKFVDFAQRQDRKGSWTISEIDDLKAAMSGYLAKQFQS